MQEQLFCLAARWKRPQDKAPHGESNNTLEPHTERGALPPCQDYDGRAHYSAGVSVFSRWKLPVPVEACACESQAN